MWGWELNLGPLEEQPVLLITESSLLPPTLTLILLLFFVFRDRVSQCSPGCSGTSSLALVHQVGLELTEICLSLSLSAS